MFTPVDTPTRTHRNARSLCLRARSRETCEVPTMAFFLSVACDFSNTVNVVKSAVSGKATK